MTDEGSTKKGISETSVEGGTLAGPKLVEPLAKQKPPKRGGFYPDRPLPDALSDSITELQASLGMPLWMLIQAGDSSPTDDSFDFCELGPMILQAMFRETRTLTRGQPIALLIDSLGGHAKSAYQMAMCVRRYCGGYTAIVPRHAKSAATILTLGADNLIMAENAELGPLDVQVFDPDREGYRSALDEVQALERLHAFSLEAADSTMFLLAPRTGKSIDKLLPVALKFCSDLMHPLLDKIDTVHFTQMSRLLKEAEEYAVRLLQPLYSEREAKRIARLLVEKYPEHSFPIDREEAGRLGLALCDPNPTQSALLDSMTVSFEGITAVGFLREIKSP